MSLSAQISCPPLAVTFDGSTHAYTFRDERTGRTWTAQAPPGAFALQSVESAGQAFSVAFTDTRSNLAYRCRVSVEPGAVVGFEITPADPQAPFTELVYPPRPRAGLEQGMMLFCNRAGGNYVPLNDPKFSNYRLTVYANTDALDMPWIGVVDDRAGDGLMVLAETPTEISIALEPDEAGRGWPQPVWFNSFGTFAYDRRISYRFSAEGGYVALARMFRSWADAQGLTKTLAQKAAERGRVDWLRGAMVVWGADGLRFARQARAAGVERCLVNGQYPPADMEAMRDLGYLVGHYDNYSDIVDGPLGSTSDNVEEVAFRDPDGSPRKGWLAKDGKQYYMRATSQALKAARQLIPALLEEYPYTARFLDVHSALQLFEDYNPSRRDGRREDLNYRRELYRYVGELGLVVGGEHGKSWCVPELDYAEGTMSGPYWWNMDVGHLLPLRSREDIHPDYLRYGIDPAVRIPLWELVYHDCLVTTWYWGDSSGYLYEIAPELSDRKDLLNILYGTVPLVWANQLGYGWDRHRDRLLQTYYTTCRIHAALTGFTKLVDHAFLSDDRLLQRTRFASGATATVNFSDEPRSAVRADGTELRLAPRGFCVEAPDIESVREWVDGAPVSRIRLKDFLYVEAPQGRPATCGVLTAEGRAVAFRVGEAWHLRLEPGSRATLDARALSGAGQDTPLRLTVLDEDGRTVEELPYENRPAQFSAGEDVALFAVLPGVSREQPLILPSGGQVSSGEKVRLSSAASDVTIHYTLDGSEPLATSAAYGEPFSLSRGTRVRARAFRGGEPVGVTAEASFDVAVPIASTGVIRGGDPARKMHLELTGVDRLEISVSDGGDGTDYDQALMGSPLLLAADGQQTFLGSLKPSAATQSTDRLRVFNNSAEPMKVAGQPFDRSVWVHAEARVLYSLDGRFSALDLWAGVPDATNPEGDPQKKNGSVAFVFTGVSKAPSARPLTQP